MDKYKILIVEDNTELLNEWKRVIEDEGYDVDIAENGKVALNLWENNIYDLLLVDLLMGELNGIELIKIIREKQQYIQIIIITGVGVNHKLYIDAINMNVFKCYLKPVDLDTIVDTVKEALKRRDPVLISLEQLAEENPDEPMLLIGKKNYTPRQIYNEVRKGTSLGNDFYDGFLKTLTDFEKPSEQSVDDLLGVTEFIKKH